MELTRKGKFLLVGMALTVNALCLLQAGILIGKSDLKLYQERLYEVIDQRDQLQIQLDELTRETQPIEERGEADHGNI